MKPLYFFIICLRKRNTNECRRTVWKCLYKIDMVLAVRWLSKSHNFITRNLNFEHTLKSNNWSYWKFIFHFIFIFFHILLQNGIITHIVRARTHCIQSKGSKSITVNYTVNDDDENKGTQIKWNTQRLNYSAYAHIYFILFDVSSAH